MSDQAPLPEAWGVLYAPPNPDGSKKKCGNCALFISFAERCAIHSNSLKIIDGMVCGYHVFGVPMVSAEPIDPKLSGLEDVSDLKGSSCSSCIYFEPTSKKNGLCHGVSKANGHPPQPVQALGCCGRWERA